MPSSVARLVALDHERLIRLLKRACSAGPNQDRWRTEFATLLRAHRAAEQVELLDEVQRSAPDLAEAASRQDREDADLDLVAEQIAAADLSADDFTGMCQLAQTAVADHGRALQSTVLDPMAGAVGRKEMRRLGGRYETRREEGLADLDTHRPPPRRLDLSRAELYELAKRAGIEGRSGMSRDQLITELQRRQIS